MTLPYTVKAKGWQDADPRIVDQFTYRTDDALPDENRGSNCSESVASMILAIYGVLDSDGTPLPPDLLKDWRLGQGKTNVIGTSADIQAMLRQFGRLDSIATVPMGMQNGQNGLLDQEWQALRVGKPVAWSGWYQDGTGYIYDGKHCVDPSGVQHSYAPGTILPAGWRYLPEIGHWRMVWKQTESTVTCADSALDADRAWDYQHHYALSRQVLVVPSVAP